jgi:CubicO group peptidase (beta-lactamase class C family)
MRWRAPISQVASPIRYFSVPGIRSTNPDCSSVASSLVTTVRGKLSRRTISAAVNSGVARSKARNTCSARSTVFRVSVGMSGIRSLCPIYGQRMPGHSWLSTVQLNSPGQVKGGEGRPTDNGPTQRLELGEALRRLKIPSASVALINDGESAWTRAYGESDSPRTLYQAASLSKLVTAVAALRLVQQGRLDLDRGGPADLVSWHVPVNDLTRTYPVTLRGLLSMTGGI